MNKLHPFAFSIVDTFGSMQMQDLERIVRLVDNNLAKDIALGLHLARKSGPELQPGPAFPGHASGGPRRHGGRQPFGHGPHPRQPVHRAHRRLHEPQLRQELRHRPHAGRHSGAHSAHQGKEPLGLLPGLLPVGKYNLHRNYAEHFLCKGDLSNRDINHLLSRIAPEKKTAFDAAYADELYASYKDNRIDDTADRARLAGLLAGRKCCALPPAAP